jgi:GTPase involved in cell partitioning and DNA repair
MLMNPIERIKIIKQELIDLEEMIKNTNNIVVMQNCQLQINEYKKFLKECREQNAFTQSRNGLLKLK